MTAVASKREGIDYKEQRAERKGLKT